MAFADSGRRGCSLRARGVRTHAVRALQRPPGRGRESLPRLSVRDDRWYLSVPSLVQPVGPFSRRVRPWPHSASRFSRRFFFSHLPSGSKHNLVELCLEERLASATARTQAKFQQKFMRVSLRDMRKKRFLILNYFFAFDFACFARNFSTRPAVSSVFSLPV